MTKRIVAKFAGESADCATSRRTQEMVAYVTLAPPLQCHIDATAIDASVHDRTFHPAVALLCAYYFRVDVLSQSRRYRRLAAKAVQCSGVGAARRLLLAGDTRIQRFVVR